jgi:hypothetical protein
MSGMKERARRWQLAIGGEQGGGGPEAQAGAEGE